MMAADLAAWLTKQEAAAAIGVSTKTIEKFAQANQLQQASRKNPATGASVAVYHPDDVQRLQAARKPAARAFVVPAAPNGNRHDPRTALERAAFPAPGPVDELLRAVLAILQAASQKSENAPEVRLSERLFLSVREAALVSGLSIGTLRGLVKAGKLEAVGAGRGRRIRRRDLEAL